MRRLVNMKRFALPTLLAVAIIVSAMPVSSASVTSGTKCPKVGAKQIVKGKVFTCIKLGSKLYWNNGVMVKKPAAQPTPSKQTPKVTPTPQPIPQRVVDCDLAPIPQLISNPQAEWIQEDLVLTFNYNNKIQTDNCRFWPGDAIVPIADTVSEFVLELTVDGIRRETPRESFPVNKSLVQQRLVLTKELNRETIGIFYVKIAKVCVYARNKYGKKTEPVCTQQVPNYVLNLPTP